MILLVRYFHAREFYDGKKKTNVLYSFLPGAIATATLNASFEFRMTCATKIYSIVLLLLLLFCNEMNSLDIQESDRHEWVFVPSLIFISFLWVVVAHKCTRYEVRMTYVYYIVQYIWCENVTMPRFYARQQMRQETITVELMNKNTFNDVSMSSFSLRSQFEMALTLFCVFGCNLVSYFCMKWSCLDWGIGATCNVVQPK